MAKIIKSLGIILIMTVFSFISCDDSSNENNGEQTSPVGNLDFTGTLSITPNSAFVGVELTANYNGNENITLVYQWKMGTIVIGTNSNKYTPYEAGNYSVTISATGYNSKTSNIVTVEEQIVIPWDGTYNYDWFNNTDTEFVINTAEELAGFARIVNGTRENGDDAYSFSGKTIKLVNNINLNDIPWTPIGRYDEITFWKNFNGTFDGNGKIISGLYINDPSGEGLGLFGCTGSTGVIKKLGVSGNITSYAETGGIIWRNGGTIENCYSNVNVFSYYYSGGGIAGVNLGTIQNCYATGVIQGIRTIGGIVGNNQSTLQNCVALNSSVISGSANNIGRVFGYYVGYGRANNFGLVEMDGATMLFTEKTSSGKDGMDVSKEEAETENWWKATSPNGPGWNFTNIWRWDNNEKVPRIR